MNNKTFIKIQSIVDVITNSSTEVFVMATDSTVKYATQLLCSILNIKEGEVKNRFKIYKEENTCYNDYDLYDVTLVIESKTGNKEDLEAIKLIKNFAGSYEHDAVYIG